MKLEKTRIRVPLPEPLFGIVKSFLSGRDKELFVAAWERKKSDAEIAETFGADAARRLRELEREIGDLVSLQIDCAAWKAAMKVYRTERDALQDCLATRDRASESVRAAQEIGELPPVVDPERKRKAEKSFLYFCQAYFPSLFHLAWSEIHFRIVAKIERVVRNGERFALATPRGTGKTIFSALAVLWAALTGKTDYVVLIAASSEAARLRLDIIKMWLATNEKLLVDFPEVCVPIRQFGGDTHCQKSRRYLVDPTRIEWSANRIVFSTLIGPLTRGVVIQCAGMSSAKIRELQYVRADGRIVRPTLAFIDDPQTRDSARSKSQTDVLEQIIKADILGMAGPGKKIALLITTTVTAADDLACRLLDRKKNPDFRGEKYRLLEAPPTNVALWDEYRAIFEAELANDGDGSEATEFYRENREAMDEGAVASWPARFNDDEISAIQFAMNLKFRDEATFLSEYQNEPLVVDEDARKNAAVAVC